MAKAQGEPETPRGLVLRAALAAAGIAAFLLARDSLSPRALVTARFGIGVGLFALLVDLGRTLVGARDPLEGEITPHRQDATPRVDDRYKRVHEPVKRFVDEGVWTQSYEALLEEAFDAEDVPPADRERALAQARDAATPRRPAGPPVTGALLAGTVVTVGLSLAVGTLMEALGAPVLGPVLLVVGIGLGLLQLRAHDTGARWLALALGLVGSATVGLIGFQMGTLYPGPWWLVVALGGGMLVATFALAILGDATPPPWDRLEPRLTERLSTLRRAFLLALLGGGVLFPFKPLLEELFAIIGWPFEVPYRITTLGYGTLAAYLAIEMGATWYGLSNGREQARAQRAQRVAANTAILDLLDEHAPRVAQEGRST